MELHLTAQHSRLLQKTWSAVPRRRQHWVQSDGCRAGVMDHELRPRASSWGGVGWLSSLAPTDCWESHQHPAAPPALRSQPVVTYWPKAFRPFFVVCREGTCAGEVSQEALKPREFTSLNSAVVFVSSVGGKLKCKSGSGWGLQKHERADRRDLHREENKGRSVVTPEKLHLLLSEGTALALAVPRSLHIAAKLLSCRIYSSPGSCTD